MAKTKSGRVAARAKVAAGDGVSASAGEWVTPRTPDELHAWIERELHLTLVRRALIEGHHAPFEYVVHSFFEGLGALPRDEHADATSDPQAAPPVREGAHDCIVWANRGGGKTFLGAVATLLDLLFKPGIEIRILGGSMEQSRRMHAHLRRLLDPRRNERIAAEVSGKITERRIVLRNGSEVELLAQSQASVRGTRVQKLRCDEVELFDREVWEAAQLTTRSKRCGEFEVRGTIECLSTMHLPHGLMHELLGQVAEGRRVLFKWGVVDALGVCGAERACRAGEVRAEEAGGASDCPLLPECAGKAKAPERVVGHITIDDAIRMKSRVSLRTWQAEMLCLRPRRTDSVLPEFDVREHVFAHDAPVGSEGVRWVGGMDFGFRNATVILWACVDAEDVLWVMDERHEQEKLLGDHIDALLQGRPRERAAAGRDMKVWPTLAWVGVDPAGTQTHEQTGASNVAQMKRAGLIVRTKKLAMVHGLELIRARLRPAGAGARPRLYVHARCVKLIESLERYHYDASKPESDVPVKDGFDHAVDALRYLVQNLDRPVRVASSNYM